MRQHRDTKPKIDWRLLAIIALAGSVASVSANGFRLPDQDAFSTARGEAFVATADNASAVYYNPAGVSQLEGWNFRAGIYGIYLPMSYESPNGRTYDNKKTLQAAPQLFGAYKPEGSPFSFGLGIYAPSGLGLKWPQDSGFRTVGTESQLTYLSINPVVAWQISPKLSVGAGLTINYASADLRSGLVRPDRHNDEFRFNSDLEIQLRLSGSFISSIERRLGFGAVLRTEAFLLLGLGILDVEHPADLAAVEDETLFHSTDF